MDYHFADVKNIFQKLINFDTTSHLSNLDLINYIQVYLKKHQFETYIIHNSEKTKANLWAHIGPTDKPGILLSGHTDVVPVTGQNWDTDPFILNSKNNCFWGRGTSDMKGFIAVVLSMAPVLKNLDLKTPIYFAFSYDEEVGCMGVPDMIEDVVDKKARLNLCIIGEPTEMEIVNGHKGKLDVECTINGHACHSSLTHKGVNAIEYASKLIVYLKSLEDQFSETGPFDYDFDPPYTTVHTGVIQGGQALNIVPNQCKFEFEFRNLPTHSANDIYDQVTDYAKNTLEQEMRKIDRKTGFLWNRSTHVEGLRSDIYQEGLELVQYLAQTNEPAKKVSFGTEAGLFQKKLSAPTVICGPGSIEQAHKPNEFVSYEQISKCHDFMQRLVKYTEGQA